MDRTLRRLKTPDARKDAFILNAHRLFKAIEMLDLKQQKAIVVHTLFETCNTKAGRQVIENNLPFRTTVRAKLMFFQSDPGDFKLIFPKDNMHTFYELEAFLERFV